MGLFARPTRGQGRGIHLQTLNYKGWGVGKQGTNYFGVPPGETKPVFADERSLGSAKGRIDRQPTTLVPMPGWGPTPSPPMNKPIPSPPQGPRWIDLPPPQAGPVEPGGPILIDGGTRGVEIPRPQPVYDPPVLIREYTPPPAPEPTRPSI